MELSAPSQPVPVTACMVIRASSNIWGITTGNPNMTIRVLELAPFIDMEAIRLKEAAKEKLARIIVAAKSDGTSRGELKIMP